MGRKKKKEKKKPPEPPKQSWYKKYFSQFKKGYKKHSEIIAIIGTLGTVIGIVLAIFFGIQGSRATNKIESLIEEKSELEKENLDLSKENKALLEENLDLSKETKALLEENLDLLYETNMAVEEISEALKLNDTEKAKELLNQLEEATSSKEKFKAILDKFSEDFFKRVKLAIKLKHYREAVYFCERITDSESNLLKDPSFWFNCGNAYTGYAEHEGGGLDAYHKAIEYQSKNVELNELSLTGYYNLGYNNYYLGIRTNNTHYIYNAIGNFTSILNRQRFPDALFGRGLSYLYLKDFLKALENFDSVKAEDENYLDAMSLKAHTLYFSEKYDESFDIINQIENYPPESYTNYVNYETFIFTKSLLLKERGIKENDNSKLVESLYLLEGIKPHPRHDNLCGHAKNLIYVLTKNWETANSHYMGCIAGNVFSGIKILPITPFDKEEIIDVLLDLPGEGK